MNKTLAIFIGSIIAPACGQWVNLPTSNGEISAVIEQIQEETGAEEIIISDYENIPFEIGEYSNPYQINEQAEELDEYDEYDRMILDCLMEEAGMDFDEAREVLDNGNYRFYDDCYNMTDVAYAIIDECGDLNGVPEHIARYFDYEAYGRDLDLEGHFYPCDGGMLEVWY